MAYEKAIRRARSGLRRIAETLGGLPSATADVDRPSPAAAADITRLWLRNSLPWTRERIVNPASASVVSLTTYGPRLRDVWLTVESIGRGTVRPGHLILWLDNGTRLTHRIRRLRRRGLTVRSAPASLRSYKKFWPYVSAATEEAPLIIADDDVVYPVDWLEGLMRAHTAHPDDVIAYRAHIVGMDESGGLLPYAKWLSCDDDSASFAHFATGVSGVLYPIGMQRALREDGDVFLSLAPTADDVWLHRTAVMHEFRIRQALPGQRHWPFIPGSQGEGLNTVNVQGGANDSQLEASHTPLTRRRVLEDLAESARHVHRG